MEVRMQGRNMMLVAAAIAAVGCTKTSSSTTDTGAAAATATAAAVDKTAAEAEIRAGDAAFFDAVKAKNANAAADLYANDAVSMPANSPPLKTHADIVKFNDDFFKLPQVTLTGETETIKFSDDGTMAYAIGKYTASWVDAKGKKVTEDGKYLNVLGRVDGKWKIVVDAFSGNAAPKM
jgi:uncharacterized protein (TIGR02246 family)